MVFHNIQIEKIAQTFKSRAEWLIYCNLNVSLVSKKQSGLQKTRLCRWEIIRYALATCVAGICHGTFQADSHALLVAERGVEYHKLSYQGKIDYWQEVKIEIIAPWCDHDDDTDTDEDELNIDN